MAAVVVVVGVAEAAWAAQVGEVLLSLATIKPRGIGVGLTD